MCINKFYIGFNLLMMEMKKWDGLAFEFGAGAAARVATAPLRAYLVASDT